MVCWCCFVAAAFMSQPRTATAFSVPGGKLRSTAAFVVPSATSQRSSGRTTTTTTTTTQLDLRRLRIASTNLLGNWKLRSPSRHHQPRDGPHPPLVVAKTKNGNRATGVAAPRSSEEDQHNDSDNNSSSSSSSSSSSRQRRMRQRIQEVAKNVVWKPILTATTIAPMPQAIATVLKEATLGAVDMAVDEGELLKASAQQSLASIFVGWLASKWHVLTIICFLIAIFIGFNTSSYYTEKSWPIEGKHSSPTPKTAKS